MAFYHNDDQDFKSVRIQIDKYDTVTQSKSPNHKVCSYFSEEIVLLHLSFDFFVSALNICPDSPFKTREMWYNGLIWHAKVSIGLKSYVIIGQIFVFVDIVGDVTKSSTKVNEAINNKCDSRKRECDWVA